MEAPPVTHASAGRPDLLLVASTEPLLARVDRVLAEWRLGAERVTEAQVVSRVEFGHCRVVVVEKRPRLKLFVERLRAAGAVVVVLGERTDSELPDVDFAVRPTELVAAVYRAQGRLAGVEAGGSLERVNRFAQAIATQFTMPDLTSVAMARTRELCEAEGASLLLVDHHTGELWFDAVSGGATAIERVRLARGQGVAGKVAVEARPRLVVKARECPDFNPEVDRRSGFATGSIVAAPLVLGGDVLGVLMAVRSESSPPFSPLHLERLVQLTPHVAIAVHNVQITSQLRASQAAVLEANVHLEEKVKERTAQISRAKAEWERTFDAIDEPISLLEGYTIRRTNQAYARRVGRAVKDLPGQPCYRVFAGRDRPCPGCPLSRDRSAALAAEIDVEPMPGARATFRFSGYWLSDEPGASGVVITYHDVTHARQLQDRLRESERLAAVGQLASGAAHEINNPLGFVVSNLRSLRGVVDELRAPARSLADVLALAREGRSAEVAELLERLPEPELDGLEDALEMIDESLDGARRVGEIVKGLRELSRLEIGKREPANVNASVTRAVRSELDKASAEVVLELKATLAADIPPLQLDQVLAHLLRNARLAVQGPQRIVVRTFDSQREVVVQVKDEGVGIPRENLRRVFEPFFTTRGVGKGIGLGLTAAYGIVKRAGGDIEAESEGPGTGATFTVRLAVAAAVPAPLERVA